MTKDLTTRLQGVIAPVPPAGDDDNDHLEPDPLKGQNKDEGDNEGGRTLENVYGEMRRRQEDSDLRNDQRLATMESMVQSLVSGFASNPPAAKTNTDPGKQEPTVAQLRQARDEAEDPARRAQLNDLLIETLADQRANAAIEDYAASTAVRERETKANQEAVNRYPDLLVASSPLYIAVQQAMGGRADADRPGVILDVANDVAIAMGISPLSHGFTREAHSVARGGGSGKPLEKGQDKRDEELGVISDEEFDRIAERLAPAMRSGKFSKENRESIKAKDREMKEIISEHGMNAFRS